jgi:hypothetical protein
MNWYLTKMIFRIVCGDGDHTPQFDEQLRLIQAGSREEAFHKAQLLGGKEEEMFFNNNQQLVQWQFISISELYQLQDFIDGAELYSKIEEKEDAQNYIHVVHRKAEQIMFGNTLATLNLV